jgi:hypothetical protein
MRIPQSTIRGAASVLALSLLATLSGCNQSTQEPAAQTAPRDPADSKPAVLGEGQKLEGADLQAFLKRMEEQPSKPAPVVENGEAAPLPKSAAGENCLIDFNSVSGLSAMTDHAYTYYATYPWYAQPCADNYKANVIPIGYSSYYLPSEVPTCSSAPKSMGTPATYPCKNTKDAALFPRRAANATPSTGDLGLWIYMNRFGVSKNFDLKSIRVWEGNITLYAFRADINGWWYWNLVPAYWTFPWNSTNINQIQIFAQNKNGMYTVDDIQVTTRP